MKCPLCREKKRNAHAGGDGIFNRNRITGCEGSSLLSTGAPHLSVLGSFVGADDGALRRRIGVIHPQLAEEKKKRRPISPKA